MINPGGIDWNGSTHKLTGHYVHYIAHGVSGGPPGASTDFGVQVYYVPARSIHPITDVVTKACKEMTGPRIGVTTTALREGKKRVRTSFTFAVQFAWFSLVVCAHRIDSPITACSICAASPSHTD